MDVYKEFVKDDQVLRILQDHYPMNPRTEWDNFGTMVCFMNRHSLGDEGHGLTSSMFDDWRDLEKYLYSEEDALTVIPLYVMNHSGLSMQTTPYGGMYGYFDSGQAGFIYISKKKVRSEYGKQRISKKLKDKVIDMLLGEIETYDQYLRNDTYSFEIVKVSTCDLEHEHEKHIDSCGGFFGSDFEANGLYETANISSITEWSEL